VNAEDAAFREKLDKYFLGFLRRAFHWAPAYKNARLLVEYKTAAGKRYACTKCGGMFERRETQVDHIKPVIPVTGWGGSWDEVRERCFVPVSGLQVWCKPCHKKKTNAENKERWK
jgi:5-methylcytosine-specific restriction endonuclease McrA